MTDPISDMLTRIRNAQQVRKNSLEFPSSKIKDKICRILLEEGYVESVEVVTENKWPVIRVGLKYYKSRPVIEEIKRISRPGRRHYVNREEIPRVYGGLGIAILSTSQGIMSSRKAKKLGVGGELLCTVF